MTWPSPIETVGALYDAALDRGLWPEALRSLTRAFDGHAFTLFLLEKCTGHVPIMYAAGFPQQILEDYQREYSLLDPGVPFVRADPSGLPCFQDYHWIDEPAMDRHVFYEWLERISGARYRLAGLIADTPAYFGVTALQRTWQQGPPGETDQRLFLALLPHIRRATRISQELGALKAARSAWEEAIDRLSTGVLLLDRAGRLVFLNRVAAAILDQHDGLGLDRAGRLRAALTSEARDLSLAVAAAAATGAGAGLDAGGIRSITRPSGKRSYVMLVAPLGDRRAVLGLRPAPAAIVFISDPVQVAAVPIDLLRRAYGLTAAEARLADALARGLHVSEAAAEFGVTAGTGRDHLKSIFAKTNTHSQSELARLVASSASPSSAAVRNELALL